MLEKFLEMIPDKQARNVAFTLGGLGTLLTGQKVVALGLFGKGVKGLEECWREAHPQFHGGLTERWNEALRHYEATHRHPANRRLHTFSMPAVVGGTAGLLIFAPFRPLWFVSAAAFAGGCAANLVGHVLYETGAPAFADDPLAFLAGPVCSAQRLMGRPDVDRDDEGDVVNVAGEAASA